MKPLNIYWNNWNWNGEVPNLRQVQISFVIDIFIQYFVFVLFSFNHATAVGLHAGLRACAPPPYHAARRVLVCVSVWGRMH